MTEFRMTDDMVLALSKWTAEKIAEAVAPLKRKIAELETKQVELANWKYLGIWTTGFYHRGNFVTFDGSLWTCLADTHARPGEDPRGWQLCVKRGRDGRDAPSARAATPHRNGGSLVEHRPRS